MKSPQDLQALDKVVSKLLERVKEQTAQTGNPHEMRFTKKDEWKGDKQ